jgi:D-xylose transport system substrate-binding protein
LFTWFRRGVALLLLASVLCTSRMVPGSAEPVAASAKTHPIIALLLAQLTPRWVRDYQYLKSRLGSLYPSAEVFTYNANLDPTRQLGQADEALGKGAKVLVVVGVDPVDAATIVSRAHRSGAKVVAYDHTIRSSQVDLFDSFDATAVGRQQARWLEGHVHRGGTIVIINGPKSSATARVFRKSYFAVLGKSFRIHRLRNGGEYWTRGWTAIGASREMAAALNRTHSRVQGVLAADDDLADGAITSLSLVGLQGKARVTGQDASVVGLRHILLGQQSMTIYKPVYLEAYAAAEAINAFLRGRRLPSALESKRTAKLGHGREVLFQPTVITRQTLKQAFSDGTVRRQEVCQGPQLKKLCASL